MEQAHRVQVLAARGCEMRCVRCHGLMVTDENRSRHDDLPMVNGMRCVNCGYFRLSVMPNGSMSRPRQVVRLVRT